MTGPVELEASIVILTKNGGPLFRRCLAAIFDQEYAGGFEVIIVDSGSTDDTIDVALSYPVRLTRIQPEEFDFGLTRDLGFSLARGRWIVTLSQDVVPASRDWLGKLIEPFSDDQVAAVQGNCILPEPAAGVFFWWRIGKFYFSREAAQWMRLYGFGLSNTCSAVRREAWERVRIGPAPMAEDRVFQKRLAEQGYRFAYAFDAVAYHGHDYPTLRGLAHRCQNEGLGLRHAGITYTAMDMVLDMLSPGIHRTLLQAICRRAIRRPSEILFPLVRPIFLFKGNHFAQSYKS